MARDRQRAKQRRARRAAQNPGPAPSEPHRSNVPGELDHASGEVDEFEAALVAGADGEPADDADSRTELGSTGDTLAEPAPEGRPESLDEVDEAFEPDEDESVREREPVAAGSRDAVAARPGAPAPAKGGPARFAAFLRASWAELQRVQWPDRKQVGQATAVVLGFVVVAGAYLGVADKVAQEVVDLII